MASASRPEPQNSSPPRRSSDLGGDVSRRKSRDMKKHPVDGAHARARTLRQNMTQAERRVWQILRSHRIEGKKIRLHSTHRRNISAFFCLEKKMIVEIDGGQHDR